jgi:hypothetical protein
MKKKLLRAKLSGNRSRFLYNEAQELNQTSLKERMRIRKGGRKAQRLF